MICRTARCHRLDTLKAERSQIEFIDINVHDPNRIILANIVIEAGGK